MKGVLSIFIVIILGVGFLQHYINKENIKESTIELYEDNDLGDIKVEGINLPLSFTFLAQEVVAEVFYTRESGDVGSVDVVVTPIEGLPIISIFVPTKYLIRFDLGITNLLRQLGEQVEP